MRLDDFLRAPPASDRKTIAVPMANDPDIIGCVSEALGRGLANFILIGERSQIEKVATAGNVNISAAEFVHADQEEAACMTAADLVHQGRAQVLMKGLVSTANFTRAILNKENGFIPEGGLISHVGLFEIQSYHKLLVITDAAINIAPTLEQKAGILQNAVDFARSLGIPCPKVACITPVEKIKEKIPSTVDAQKLKQMGDDGVFGKCLVDGPLALDIAVSSRAAEIKGIRSLVAGDPDILLMPGLDAANALYKSLTTLANARTASIVAGVRMPVVLTSRADSEETRLLSLALGVRL